MAQSDSKVIRRSVRSPEAFETIFDRHYDAVFAFLFRRSGAAVADDLASEVFLTAFRRRGDYDESQVNAMPWLFGIANNLLRAHSRNETRRTEVIRRLAAEPASEEGIEEDVVDRAAAQDLRGDLITALEHLGPHQQDALLLSAWEELTPTEISVVLEAPVGTVRSWLSRARRSMREAVGPTEACMNHERSL